MQKIIITINSKYTDLTKTLKSHPVLGNLYEKYGQIIKFAIAGASGAVVELGLYTLLVSFFSVHYLTANILSIITGILVNYLISQKWVFESGRYQPRAEFLAFCVVSAITIAFNQTIVWLLVDYAELHNVLAKIMAILTVAIFNFFAKKYLVFKN
jgi:putative flippase GtrA